MSETVIKLENLSKRYRLGLVGTNTLKGDIQAWWYRLLGKDDPTLIIGQENQLDKSGGEYVWALKDINLDVEQGEILGIIGKNGAGKSTLLKLLSQVTGPTTGQIKVKGRIASLLEVGTGFHPELTGKENIFLNGAILGMTKNDIKLKLDEIVEFAGVAKYIDTPVKRYSSGMYVRLAFAVAAHLEPDILVVDEVLAVGDAEFQKKAIGKMQDVSKDGGRTVLFVSHNMTSVRSLCTKAILLSNGKITDSGFTDIVISKYLKGDSELSNHKFSQNKPLISLSEIEILEICVKGKNKSYDEIIKLEDEIEFYIKFKQLKKTDIHITIHLKDELGNVIFSTGSEKTLNIGSYKNFVFFPGNFFNWGKISVDLFIIETTSNGVKALIIEKDILEFSIVNSVLEIGNWMGKEPGAIHPKFNWITEKYETN